MTGNEVAATAICAACAGVTIYTMRHMDTQATVLAVVAILASSVMAFNLGSQDGFSEGVRRVEASMLLALPDNLYTSVMDALRRDSLLESESKERDACGFRYGC